MKKLLQILCIAFVLLSTSYVYSQDDETGEEKKCNPELGAGADLYSRYVWRGTMFGGSSPSIQPYASIAASNLEIGFWGAYSLGGENPFQEMDFYIGYTFLKDMMTFTFTDYYFPNEAATYNYFEFAKDSTGHIFETMLSFNGTEKLPLSFSAAVNVYGADAAKIESDNTSADFNTKTGIQYSTYFELGYANSFKGVDYNIFTGFTLASPQEEDTATGYIGETGLYGSKAGLVNVGFSLTREMKITDNFSLPVHSSFIVNPDTKRAFLLFGVSF